MTNGKHIAPKTDRKGWRRLLPTGVVGWLTLAGSGIALAAWLIFTGFTGTTTTGNIELELLDASTLNGDCVVTGDFTLDQINVTWTDAFGGETCEVEAVYNAPASNATTVTPQSFDLVSADFAGGGMTAILDNGDTDCGESIAPGATSHSVTVLLTVDEAASSPGDSFTFDPATDGIKFVPLSSFDPAACS